MIPSGDRSAVCPPTAQGEATTSRATLRPPESTPLTLESGVGGSAGWSPSRKKLKNRRPVCGRAATALRDHVNTPFSNAFSADSTLAGETSIPLRDDAGESSARSVH